MRRRIGAKTSKTRAALLKAAVELIGVEGVFSLTAGRLGEKIGVSRQTVHYYFGTMDELLVAVLRHAFSTTLNNVRNILTEKKPVDAIWHLFSSSNAVTSEFMALALRNEAIGITWRELRMELQKEFHDAITMHIDPKDKDSQLAAEGAALLLQVTSQYLSFEKSLGMSRSHEEVKKIVTDIAMDKFGIGNKY